MNAERKWTPGPWMAAARPSSIVGWPVVSPAAMGRSICNVTVGHDESGANAHLIAAAPDMYEALQESLELAELATELTGCRGDDDYVWGLRDKLKAVLSKANGAAS